MAFIPKEQPTRRTGVAIGLRDQNPEAHAESRDAWAAREASKFTDGHQFGLDRGVQPAPFRRSKKTFDHAMGNGNIIAPEQPVVHVAKRVVGPRVLDEHVQDFVSHDHQARDQAARAAANAPHGWAERFSDQKPQRHQRVVRAPVKDPALGEVSGFPGLGHCSRDRTQGKGYVGSPYHSPMPEHGFGLKQSAAKNDSSVSEHLQYKVGEPDRRVRRRGPGRYPGEFDGPSMEYSGERSPVKHSPPYAVNQSSSLSML